jgi:hypothetical protein
VRVYWVGLVGAGLALACDHQGNESAARLEQALSCGIVCSDRGIREGHSAISADREVDGYFEAIEQLSNEASLTAEALGQTVAQLERLGMAAATGRATQDALIRRFALRGDVSVEPGPANCSIAGQGLARFLGLNGCECEQARSNVDCRRSCDGYLKTDAENALVAQALELRGAAEQRCLPTSVGFTVVPGEATTRDELEAFVSVASAHLAEGFAQSERGARLLSAIARAQATLEAEILEQELELKFAEVDELAPKYRLLQTVNLSCAFEELSHVSRFLDDRSRTLGDAVAQWERVISALTPR